MDNILNYIKEGEHQQQDFKFRVDDAKKIARTLAAFSNTDGGRLLIGVKDNGKIVGVFPQEEIHMIEAAATLYCSPKVTFKASVHQVKHKQVLTIEVLPMPQRLIKAKDEQDKWKVYIRKDDHTLLANKIWLGVRKQQNNKTTVPQTFGDEEQSILAVFKENGAVTLSQLYRHTKINKKKIDEFLILLIKWEVVKMNMLPLKTTYQLVDTPSD